MACAHRDTWDPHKRQALVAASGQLHPDAQELLDAFKAEI